MRKITICHLMHDTVKLDLIESESWMESQLWPDGRCVVRTPLEIHTFTKTLWMKEVRERGDEVKGSGKL